jgi:lipoprotein NlpD
MTTRKAFVALWISALLAGCASTGPAPVAEGPAPKRIEAPRTPPAAPPAVAEKVHIVKKGETLYGIARAYGLNPRDLAAWNALDDTHRITVGQTLRLTPPAAPAQDAVEVRPIAGGGAIAARPLDGAAAAASPAPSLPPAQADAVKRQPKGGKLPYSEANLALLKSGGFAAPAAASAASSSGGPAPKAAEAPTKPVETTKAVEPAASGIEWGWPASGKVLAGFSDGSGGAQGINRGIDIAGKIGDPVRAAAAGKVIYVGSYPKYGNLVVLLHADGYSSVYAHNQRILVKEGEMVKRGETIAELGDSDADQPKLHFELRHKGKPLDPLKLLPPR